MLCRPSLSPAGVLPRVLAWSLAAAAVCYTNYFGIVVVAFVWLVGLWRGCTRRRPLWPWLSAGVIALALYSPWLVPLYRQAALFPAPDASLRSIAAAAARTLMALTAGNLASLAAWWVWLPMGLFCLSLAVLLVRRWRQVWPVAAVVLGCFAVGVATRTMIDKYVMTFSGPACLLVAALLTRRRQSEESRPLEEPQPLEEPRPSGRAVSQTGEAPNLGLPFGGSSPPANPASRESPPPPACRLADRPPSPMRRLTSMAVTLLFPTSAPIRHRPSSFILHPSSLLLLLAWLACAFNLVTEKHWSSLRWLDPFEQALTDVEARVGLYPSPPARVIVVLSHPSARYYGARFAADAFLRRRARSTTEVIRQEAGGTERKEWQWAVKSQALLFPGNCVMLPDVCLAWLKTYPHRQHVLVTIETAGFADLPEWDEVHRILQRDYLLIDERQYLEDPDAAWKDRLDPAVKHPPWRITVRWWKRIESAELKTENDEK
jgi:hypothetical protein